MHNILDEYLIRLGASVDQTGMRNFQNALRDAASLVDHESVRMAKSFLAAQTEIVGGFLAIGGAALGLVDKVAMADQEYRLFALHMYMSKDAARALKVSLDALGVSLEDATWDTELRGRVGQLIEDQRRMAPGGDFDKQMRQVRDIRFEFTRMEVELKYLAMHTVMDFLHALGTGPEDLLEKLRKFNEWVIKDMPGIAQRLSDNFMPIWEDIKVVVHATVDALKEFSVLFTNVVGLLSGDTSIEGTELSLEKLSKAVQHTAEGFAGFATLIAHTEAMLAHWVNAITLVSSGKFSEAGAELKAGADAMTTKELMTLMGGGFGLAFGGPLGAVAGAGAMHEFGGALEKGLGPTAAAGTPPSLQQLVHAMIGQESGGNPLATSNKGAMGLMQLMPQTALALGVTNPYDPIQNVQAGTMYIQQMLAKYHDTATALAAYNAGPGRIDQVLAGKATLPSETRDYVSRIMGNLGATGDVHIGSITIPITQPNASPREIQQAVTRGVRDATNDRVQRNLAEMNGLAWSQ
jgi:hypothetical protein